MGPKNKSVKRRMKSGGTGSHKSPSKKSPLNGSKTRRSSLNEVIKKKHQASVMLICPETHSCLAFGKTDGINGAFHGYRDFSMLSKRNNIFRRVSQGANGFVNELVYELPYQDIDPTNKTADKYYVYTILKSSIDRAKNMADNLFYEAYVGKKYINQLSTRFPCFLETYNVFRYNKKNIVVDIKDDQGNVLLTETHNAKSILENDLVKLINGEYEKMKKNGFDKFLSIPSSSSTSNNPYLSDLLDQAPFDPVDINDIGASVVEPNNICIQIQHVHNAVSLHGYIDKLYNAGANISQKNLAVFEKFVKFELNVVLPAILFQVASCLDALKTEYSHNDLHMGNILLYNIPVVEKQKYMIQFDYKDAADDTCTIYSPYIVKIIDYGRNHVSSLSEKFYDELCKHTNKQGENTNMPSILDMPPPYDIAITMNNATTANNSSITKYLGGTKTCGKELGYNFWDKFDNKSEPDKNYVSCRMLNNSVDLLFVFRLGSMLYVSGLIDYVFEEFRDIIDKVLFFYIYSYGQQLKKIRNPSNTNPGEYAVINKIISKLEELEKIRGLNWNNPTLMEEVELNKYRNSLKMIIDMTIKIPYFAKPYGIHNAKSHPNMITNISDLYAELKKYCIMIKGAALSEFTKLHYKLYSSIEIDLKGKLPMKRKMDNNADLKQPIPKTPVAKTPILPPPPPQSHNSRVDSRPHPMNSYV